MATVLEIWNQALRMNGEARLLTLTDDVSARYIIENAWPDVVMDCVTNGVWNFAIKTVSIDHNPAATPSIGYQFAFDKPADWLHTNAYSTFPDFRDYVQTDFQVIRDQGGRWHADNDTLYVEYISSDATLDENVGTWSVPFVQYVAAALAFDITERLTHSTALSEKLEKEMTKRRNWARSQDAKDERETRIRPGSWARAQTGSGFRSNRQRLQSGGQITTRPGNV